MNKATAPLFLPREPKALWECL